MKYFQLALIALAMISCTMPQKESYTQEQLYTKMSSGVVLIQNTHFYIITTKGDATFDYIFSTKNGFSCEQINSYYNGIKDSIINKYKDVIFGTGFLISNKGAIVTNSHIISPEIDTTQIYNALVTYIINDIEKSKKYLEEDRKYKKAFEEALSNYSLSPQKHMEYKEYVNKCNNSISLYEKYIPIKLKELRCKEYQIKICSQIKIAYSGSKIISDSDLQNCIILKNVPNYDLGIIQVTTGEKAFWNEYNKYADKEWSVPIHIKRNAQNIKVTEDKYIFEMTDKTNVSNEEIKLYMIGFNQGANLALTNEGIKAQITQGNISQNTDSIKMMYSIPALHGSSGSPVVNQYGELIAINFAGISSTQSFNYGIRVERLKEILDDAKLKEFISIEDTDDSTSTQIVTDSI